MGVNPMKLEIHASPTTVTAEDGQFHPAIAASFVKPIMYWPEIKMESEDGAYEWAKAKLAELNAVVAHETEQYAWVQL